MPKTHLQNLTPEERLEHDRKIRRECKQRYVANNREKVNKQRRDHRNDNKDSINTQQREYSAQYRADNRDRINQSKAAWLERNPDKQEAIQARSLAKPEIQEASRQRVSRFRSTEEGKAYQVQYIKAYMTIPAKRLQALCAGAKRRAEKAGLPFDEDLRDYLALNPPVHCPCCGKVLDYSVGRGANRNDSPSLDRMVGSLGYTKLNVRVICWRCNDLKRNATAEELLTVGNFLQRELLNTAK